MLDETHDPHRTSWVASANIAGTDFPLQNLPYGVFRRAASSEPFRIGVAIGSDILDLRQAHAQGAFDGLGAPLADALLSVDLVTLMAAGPDAWATLRKCLFQLLGEGAPRADALRACLVAQSEAEYALPARIGDYTDFLSSLHHMKNMARIFTPGAPVIPNFRWQPLAYHGRASSIEVSGTHFRRPRGQTRAPEAESPTFGPCRRLDYEVELGFFVGPGNARGTPVSIDAAEDHIFGLCLLNDWSARDIQAWESNPLGPFLAKSFVTTISPWVVTLAALEPYRAAVPRGDDDPAGFDYLGDAATRERGNIDIRLQAGLRTARSGAELLKLSETTAAHGHWSIAQMLVHHTTGGCDLRSGDLIGTGTQSGPDAGEEGCLMELTQGGRHAVALANGEQRTFLEDGDTVVLRGWCEAPGRVRIGFGECVGTVLPA